MIMDVAVVAGSASTVIFVISTLPMLIKAGRTKNLTSYSLGNIGLANAGNLIYAVYVLSLPPGPIWALHGFHLATTGLMLFWYLRHARRSAGRFPWPRDASGRRLTGGRTRPRGPDRGRASVPAGGTAAG